MSFYIPVGDTPDNTQRVQIGITVYDFRYRWNTLEEAWYCSIGLNGEDPKVQFKVVVGMDLLEQYRAYEEIPSGGLFLVDIEQTYGRPGLGNFGTDKRFRLEYLTEEEIIYLE